MCSVGELILGLMRTESDIGVLLEYTETSREGISRGLKEIREA